MYMGNVRNKNIALSIIPIEEDIQIIRADQISKRIIINDDSKSQRMLRNASIKGRCSMV